LKIQEDRQDSSSLKCRRTGLKQFENTGEQTGLKQFGHTEGQTGYKQFKNTGGQTELKQFKNTGGQTGFKQFESYKKGGKVGRHVGSLAEEGHAGR
jgi:hypothetical protein